MKKYTKKEPSANTPSNAFDKHKKQTTRWNNKKTDGILKQKPSYRTKRKSEKELTEKRNDSFKTRKKLVHEHPLTEVIKDAYRGEPFKKKPTNKRATVSRASETHVEKPFKKKFEKFEKSVRNEKEKRNGYRRYEEPFLGKTERYDKPSDKKNSGLLPSYRRQEVASSERRKTDSLYQKNKPSYERPPYQKERKNNKKAEEKEIRLNRYIANAGICSRRDADELIRSGAIKVNGNVVTELGMKVKKTDIVTYKGKVLSPERLVYILLNKPKDYITTTDDPEQRKTVMDLVKDACQERIYPVGRLDRNTTGLLLLTNDGELAKLLSHPSSEVEKLYEVAIDKPLTREHEAQIRSQDFVLEDGPVHLDAFEILSPSRMLFGIQLHSGRNRVVRRIFEKFGYNVEKLDRVVYAGLTKKDLPRGHWRYLSEEEIVRLKHFTVKKKKLSEQLAQKINWDDFED